MKSYETSSFIDWWQTQVKKYDVSKTNIPIGFSFSTEGRVFIKYNLSESNKIFDSFSELKIFVEQYFNLLQNN